MASIRSITVKSCAAITRQSSPKTKTPRPWLMLKPSHARHMVGAARPPKRIRVASSAGVSERSRGAKYVGRTTSTSDSSAWRPPAKIGGVVPRMNQVCAVISSHTYTNVRIAEHGTVLPAHGRATFPMTVHAERSARTRSALLESAARGLSRHGYGNLVLERVAREAGYTRGALYHQFKDKEDLALAVLRWTEETWQREVGDPGGRESDPVAALMAMARGHAVLCRRDIARVAMALRVEFSGQDHPVGRELERIQAGLVKRLIRLINDRRRSGSIPPGPPAKAVALALVGALEGAVITLAGQAPHDEVLAARAAAGVLGIAPHQ